MKPQIKNRVDNLLIKIELAVKKGERDQLFNYYNKGLLLGNEGWKYFIDQIIKRKLGVIKNGILKFN